MSLADFVDEIESRELTLTVINRTDPDPVRRMLEELFGDQPVRIEEVETEPDSPANLLLLRDDEDAIAVSSLEDVRDSVLLVNSDLYITGSRPIEEIETPEVIARLDDMPFSVEGYPASEQGKLLLIEMSRYIEARAFEHGDGTLHTGFQKLSRMADERGTMRVYDRLAGTDVDTHVYGVPDRVPEDVSATVHPEDCRELHRTWFVVFVPPTGNGHAALVAVETGRNEWDGFWTYSEGLTEDIHEYLLERYH